MTDQREAELLRVANAEDTDEAWEQYNQHRMRREAPSLVQCKLVAEIAAVTLNGNRTTQAVINARAIVDAAFSGLTDDELLAVELARQEATIRATLASKEELLNHGGGGGAGGGGDLVIIPEPAVISRSVINCNRGHTTRPL